MRARLLLIAVVSIALVAVPSAAFGRASHATSNSQTFLDSTGEDPNAPDITEVDVSNDDNAMITFHVKVSNRPTFTTDMAFVVWLDTDANSATGDPKSLGADYLIISDPTGPGLLKWNGSGYDTAPSQTSLTGSYDATGETLHVSAVDLGGTRQIKFAVRALSGLAVDANGNPDPTNEHSDDAPAQGFFSYLVIAKLTLKQIAFTTAPKPARAGGRLTATLAATESDTAGPVAKATVTCVATVKGVRLRATHTLANGVASCYWKLPKTAKGKLLHGTISITVQGTTLAKSFTARIG
ncbi:MAG TPA: hypothetical protein VGC78_11185 [Gaiellaceae bacterium]